MKNIDRSSVLPDVKFIGFACTRGARAIRVVAVMDDPVAACTGYHAIYSRVIRGVAVKDSTAAAQAGYHSYNSRVWSRHSRVGESTRRGCGVNVLRCWVPCNK